LSFRDISNLEEYVYLLNQRYSNQIPGWQTLGYFSFLFICSHGNVVSFFLFLIEDFAAGTMTTMTAGGEKLPVGDAGLSVQRLGITPVTQKLSTTSSTTSIERSNFCARFYQKCQMVCCICTPNYL
jgi:hypothetical protein